MEFCNPKTFKVFLAKSEDDYTEYTLEEISSLNSSSNVQKIVIYNSPVNKSVIFFFVESSNAKKKRRDSKN